MDRLKFLEIDGKTGLVVISFRGDEMVCNDRDLYRIGAYLPSREAWRLLRTFDGDIWRLAEAADIVDQVANYIYRGKCTSRATINIGFVRFDILIRDTTGELAYTFFTELNYKFRASGYEVVGEYQSELYVWMLLPLSARERVDEIINERTDMFLEELAEIFERPEIRRLREKTADKSPGSWGSSGTVTLYENSLRLRLLKSENPDSPLFRGYDYLFHEKKRYQ
jgi:hypothetical protein